MFGRRRIVLALVALAVVGGVALPASGISGAVSSASEVAEEASFAEDQPPPGATFRSEVEALEADLDAYATSRGLTKEQATGALAHDARVDQLLLVLTNEYGDVFFGAFTTGRIERLTTISVKGEVTKELADLVESAGDDVSVIGGSLLNWDEATAVATDVARSLKERGVDGSVVSLSVRNDKITALVAFGEATDEDLLQREVVESVLGGLATRDLDNVAAASFLETRFVLEVAKEGTDLGTGEHTYGGGEAEDDGVRECATAFTVNLPGGGTGVLTAAHCRGINGYDDQNTRPYGMPWWDEHLGHNGDLEVHTSGHVEPDDFWADAGLMRDVFAVQALAQINEGDSVCVYARTTNDRDCSSDILELWICYEPDNTGRIGCGIAAMDAWITAPGDSGGNWSWGQTAWGVHSGRAFVDGASRSVWTPVARIGLEWPGMTVRT